MTRTATVVRTTGETDITITLDLDGTGTCNISTGVGFFDHMLNALGRHSLIDLTITCKGDTWVDDHHTVEDVGIAMGQALRGARRAVLGRAHRARQGGHLRYRAWSRVLRGLCP